MHKVLQDIFRRGDLLACWDCAWDRSSLVREYREFDEIDAAPFCDFCGASLTCELGAHS